MIVKFLRLEYEDILDAMVTCDPGQVMELRGGAKAYRDLIGKLTRSLEQAAKMDEQKDVNNG